MSSKGWFATLCLLTTPALVVGQGLSTLRLVYSVTGRPAAGISVDVTDRDGRVQHLTADRSGRISAVLTSAHIVAKDAQAGIVLADRAFSSAVPREIAIGMPIRVSGEVTGFGDDPARIEIDCGYGGKLTVSDYQRMVHRTPLFSAPNEDTIHALALPPVHEKSLRVHPDGSGRFTTGWFAAHDDPELLAFRPDDPRTGVKTVKLPRNLQPRATVSAGRIAPTFGAALEIHTSIPKTQLPLGLFVGVESIEVAPASQRETAAYLSAIQRRDPALSQFLLKRRDLPVSLDGPTTIAGLPPARSLKLRFRGPEPGFEIERTVQVPSQGVVRVDLAQEQPLLRSQAPATYSGIVRFANGGGPVAGASVAYTSYPDRYEAQSGTDGRFQIANAAAGRRGLVRIEVPVPGGQPPNDRIAISQEVPPLAAGSNADQVYEIVRPSGRSRSFGPGVRQAGATGLLGQQGPPLDYTFLTCGTNYTQAEIQYVSAPLMTAYAMNGTTIGGMVPIAGSGSFDEETATAVFQAQFLNPGYFLVFLEYTPFVYDAVYVPIPSSTTASITFRPKNNMQAVQIRVRDKNNQTAVGVQLQFPGWSVEPDAYTQETDSNGNVNLRCVSLTPPPLSKVLNFNYLPVFVNDATSGYYSGNLALPGNQGVLNIKLTDPPTTAVKK